ncbi:hypothetical protein QE250_11135 [Chromatiaceae bacterium AAb-1]|nr:hypothetical protein [Chromatiaceae bacterium AAb-1]
MLDCFIEQKSQQLTFYISGFLRGRLKYSELHLFVWDTLEEWSQFQVSSHLPQSYREQVFWHLLHQLECWPENALRQNRRLRRNILDCVGYLQGKGHLPINCIGIRP